VIGFPGPKRLKDTMNGTYSTDMYFEQSYSWGDLIPYLHEQKQFAVPDPVKGKS
jgi:gluconate 2-dehydrogenase gamma chain